MDKMGWERCGEGRQEVRGSRCVEMCKNGKQVCGVVSFIHPTLPNTAHLTTSQHTTKEGSVDSIFSAVPGLNTCNEN